MLQEQSVLPVDNSVSEFNQPSSSKAPPIAKGCLVAIEPVPEVAEPPSKRPRIEETEYVFVYGLQITVIYPFIQLAQIQWLSDKLKRFQIFIPRYYLVTS